MANGQGDGVQLVSAEDYQPARSGACGDDSDNVRYDRRRSGCMSGFGAGALAAIDPAAAKVLGEVKLAGHPESFQLARGGTTGVRQCADARADRGRRPRDP